ncbi:MAG TPA: hypothetical protein VHL80_13075, partial [Polyangia bacterium]|nr:hypothetical protein [Polyangia bacterium]
MRAAGVLLLLAAACSMDWPLARRADAGARGAAVLCDTIPPLPADPAIDGVLEPGLPLDVWIAAGDPSVPAGMSASVSLAYRPDGLYVFATISDPTRDPAAPGDLTYCGDGVEVYVDDDGVIEDPPAYDIPGTMQLIMAAPGDGVTPARRGQRFVFPGTSTDSTDLGAWTSTRFVAVPTAAGYDVEAFVVADDLGLPAWTLAPGGKVGWDLSWNIGGPEMPGIDACTTRSQQVHFRLAASGACTPPYCNASALCATTL